MHSCFFMEGKGWGSFRIMFLRVHFLSGLHVSMFLSGLPVSMFLSGLPVSMFFGGGRGLWICMFLSGLPVSMFLSGLPVSMFFWGGRGLWICMFLSGLPVSMFVFWSGLVSVCMFLSGLHVWAVCQYVCFWVGYMFGLCVSLYVFEWATCLGCVSVCMFLSGLPVSINVSEWAVWQYVFEWATCQSCLCSVDGYAWFVSSAGQWLCWMSDIPDEISASVWCPLLHRQSSVAQRT